jgi:hypothetical protein
MVQYACWCLKWLLSIVLLSIVYPLFGYSRVLNSVHNSAGYQLWLKGGVFACSMIREQVMLTL